jgi:hypothetical protein
MYQHRMEEPDEPVGVAIIIHLCEPTLDAMDPRLTAMYSRVGTDFPGRTSAFHHCISDSTSMVFRAFMNLVIRPFDKEHKAKVKFHHGECVLRGLNCTDAEQQSFSH